MGRQSVNVGLVSLVGAGPGDPGLMTIKGRERLCSCDALVYDHLVHENLLSLTREDCVLIDAGKRAGGHSMPQEEINSLLIALARRHRFVVRLKGGDPFVFGRGAEECEALREAGIPYEIVPGITSAIAAAESAGLPLTYRGIARSFHVITAQRRDGKGIPQEEYRTLAAVEGTLVFLMGVGRLEEITESLICGGMDPAVPAAVIERGTLPQERRLNGRLDDIADRARRAGVVSPAILIVGETAGIDCRSSRIAPVNGAGRPGLRKECGIAAGNEQACGSDDGGGTAVFSDTLELSGRKRIFAVGSEQAIQRLSRKTAPYGIQTDSLLTLSAYPAAGYDELVRAAGQIEDFRWVCFFSRQAVGIFRRAFAEAGADVRSLTRCRFAVNGTAAEEALRGWGIHPDYVAPHPEAESFAAGFLAFLRERGAQEEAGETAADMASEESTKPRPAAGGAGEANQGPSILIPRAVRGSAEPEEQLSAAGCPVRSIRAYDMVAGEADGSDRPAPLSPWNSAAEIIVLLSGSGVMEWCRMMEREGRTIPDTPTYYCMGPKTAQVLQEVYARQTGIRLQETVGRLRIRIPGECSLQGLVNCINDGFR